MGVTRLLLLWPFYTIQTNFMYFFAHDCKNPPPKLILPHCALCAAATLLLYIVASPLPENYSRIAACRIQLVRSGHISFRLKYLWGWKCPIWKYEKQKINSVMFPTFFLQTMPIIDIINKKKKNVKSIHRVNSSAQGSCFHKMTADVSSG